MIRQPGTGPTRSKTKHAFETYCSKPASLGDLETALDCAHRCRLRSDSPYPDDAAGSRIRTSDAIASALMTLEEIERAHILNTPNRNGGNLSGSATDLGISARKFYYRLAEYQRRGDLP